MTTIIVVNEDLYCGEILDRRPVDPNTVRNYGIDFWCNPYDKYGNMFLEVYDQLTITLQIKGNKIYFHMRNPMVEDLEALNHIDITSSWPW